MFMVVWLVVDVACSLTRDDALKLRGKPAVRQRTKVWSI